MKNKNLSFTLTGRSKLFLFVCLGSAAVIDFTAFVFLVASGISSVYWVFPLLFFIADALFIVQAVFSNFRFKYTVWEIVFYLSFSLIVFLCMLGDYSSYGTVFTATASTMWNVLHILSLCAALSCYIYTAKLSKNTKAHNIVSLLFAAASAVLAVYYVISLIALGFFGQGSFYTRPLVYEYDDDTQTYRVIGVMDGNGNNVYIPKEFDGVKVSGINCSVFNAPGVEYVTLDCAADVEFYGENGLTGLNDLAEVYAPKENVDIFKNVFYAMTSESEISNFELANLVRPFGLDGETYVTFAYDRETYDIVEGEVFETWYGKKGDKFSLEYFGDIPYVIHSDNTSDDDLNWNYNYNNRRIISGFTYGGSDIVNSAVTESMVGVKISFEKIYRLFPGTSNDEKYPAERDFTYSVVGGTERNYKYATAENAQSVLDNYARDGFDIRWLMGKQANDTPILYESLESALGSLSDNDLYIYPEWELHAPSVTAACDKDNNTVVYGEQITLSADAVAPSDGITLSYEWYDGTVCKSNNKNYTILQMPYGNANYTVIVTASGENTSLTSKGSASLAVTVEKRPVTVTWKLPESNVYSGVNKEITCSLSDGVLTEDTLLLDSYVFRHKDAGTYTHTVSLTGTDSEKYRILSGQTQNYTIEKADLEVNWITLEKVYNGGSQRPDISFKGVQGEDIINYNLWGATNAGEHNCEVIITDASILKNYDVTNTQAKFVITPYPLSVVWRDDLEDTFVYDGNTHAMSAHAVGAEGNPVPLTYSVASIKDAGEYNVRVAISNSNYVIASGETKTYTITPYGLTVEWRETSLTYNGSTQAPSYVMRGLAGDGNILGGGAGMQKNVGEDYVFTLTNISPINNYERNYYIADNSSTTFSISPASVAVQWRVEQYYSYNGKEQAPSAHIIGLGDDRAVALNCKTTGAVNAGVHVSTATFEHELAENYTLTNTQTSFTINRALVAVTVVDVEITYGDSVPESFEYTISQVAEGDNENEVVTNVKFEIEGYSGGYILPGEYKITSTADVTTNYRYVSELSEGKLTVNKKKITLRIDDKQMVYGENLPAFTCTVESGELVGDDVIVLTYELDREIDGAGTYTIRPASLDEEFFKRYDYGVHYGTLTVTEADNGV